MKKISLTFSFLALLIVSLVLTGCVKPLSTKLESGQSVKTTDETTGWQTYQNAEYGFKIRYPSSWQFEIGETAGPKFEKVIKLTATFSDGLHQITTGMGEMTGLAGLEITQGSLIDYQEVHNAPVAGTTKQTTINNYQAIKEKRGFGDETAYMIEHPEAEYRVTLTDYTERFSDVLNEQEKEEMKKTINKIFSTFQFVD